MIRSQAVSFGPPDQPDLIAVIVDNRLRVPGIPHRHRPWPAVVSDSPRSVGADIAPGTHEEFDT